MTTTDHTKKWTPPHSATPTHSGSYISACVVCGRAMWNSDKRCRLCVDCAVPQASGSVEL